MSTIHRDGGETDPYTRAVSEFMEVLSERFPLHDEDLKKKDLVDAQAAAPYGNLYLRSETVNTLIAALKNSTNTSEVPQRDLALLDLHFDLAMNRSKRLSSIVIACQTAVEDAYLDAVAEDRFHFVVLAEARDALFEAEEEDFDTAVEDFIAALDALRSERQRRGFPDWRTLQDHCGRIKTMLTSMANSSSRLQHHEQ